MLPYQLNPDLPGQGMDRKTFRTARFGSWEAALAMDARAIKAGVAVGADFQYGRQAKTSNTLAGHALVRLAGMEGGAALQHRVVEALFVAYFTHGEDVGNEQVLQRIADAAGLQPHAIDRALDLRPEVEAAERALRSAGLRSVPAYIAGGRLLANGAQDVDGYVRMLAAEARSV